MTAEPCYERALPVLVCDPQREITGLVEHALMQQRRSRYFPFAIEAVPEIDTVRFKILRGKPPQYAAVFYSSSVLAGKAKTIGSITNRDPLLPQIIVQAASPPSPAVLSAARHAGAKEYVSTADDLDALLLNSFRVPSLVKDGVVLKIGGSSFDYEDDTPDPALGVYCDILVQIFGAQAKPKLMCTVGAGRRGDIVKSLHRKYKDRPRMQEQYPKRIMAALEQNLAFVSDMLTPDYSSIRTPDAFYHITTSSLRKKMQLISLAPHWVMVRDQIPLEDSDTHTIALAELYGIEHVVLLKRTDGIYSYDPMRGYRLDPATGCPDVAHWRGEQKGNKRYETVSLDTLQTVSREGTGKDGAADQSSGHLMEDSALAYFGKCRYVKEILIVHIAPHELYVAADDGLEHVVTGEKRPSSDWNAMRAIALKDALLRGAAYSKIVK